MPRPVNESALLQQFRRHHGVRIEPFREHVEVHHRILRAEGIVEAALRHAPVQRHLAAFEPALERVARTRLRALVTAAGLRALTGALPAADALLRVLRAL